jgi:hypothetical protein
MSKRTGLALVLLLAALFLAMNRGAYRGYFSDDEVDNLSWTPFVSGAGFAKALATPLFLEYNFRPVGHFYFKEMEKYFGLDFPKYVLGIHLFHLLNAWLLWVLARRLGAAPLSAGAAVLFFAFHMALFDALWKPMYVFDVLCGTLCLLSIIFYTGRRWVLSFLAFWMAYKSKELAVMLPAVLAAYEWWAGERRWKPLVPFFAASLSFGLQGILLNPNRDNDYTFRFTPAALAKTSVFYAGRVFLAPFAGFAILAAPFLARQRRAWFGLAMAALFFVPLLFLPGRLFSAYCYVPFTGLATAISALDLSSVRARAAVAALFLLWFPWDYYQMRVQRRAKLARDDEVRAWMTALGRFAARSPETDGFVYAGAPAGFQHWGIEGAIKYFYKRGGLDIHFVEDPEAARTMRREKFAMFTWDGKRLTIAPHTPGTRDVSYLAMDPATPVWQLGEGWYSLEDTYRWFRPGATARLWRPAGARRFEMRVNIGQEQMNTVGVQEVTVTVGGTKLEPRRFPRLAWQTQGWNLAPAAEGAVEVTLEVAPPFRPGNESRVLGLAVGGFGFVPETRP